MDNFYDFACKEDCPTCGAGCRLTRGHSGMCSCQRTRSCEAWDKEEVALDAEPEDKYMVELANMNDLMELTNMNDRRNWTSSAIMCGHANESPAECPCDNLCYCHLHGSCKNKSEKVIDPKMLAGILATGRKPEPWTTLPSGIWPDSYTYPTPPYKPSIPDTPESMQDSIDALRNLMGNKQPKAPSAKVVAEKKAICKERLVKLIGFAPRSLTELAQTLQEDEKFIHELLMELLDEGKVNVVGGVWDMS